LSQPIWHNGRIRVGGQPVFFSHWAKSGIFFINDLIKEDGSLLSLTDLKNNYNINIIFLGGCGRVILNRFITFFQNGLNFALSTFKAL
jgi:hypothetical protein